MIRKASSLRSDALQPMVSSRVERTFELLIVAAGLIVLVLQFRTLIVFPVADSIRWGGDETWLMREFGHQFAHGSMQYPESFQKLPQTDGVLAGSMWMNAMLYGGSGALFSQLTDLVTIGRVVTSCLAVLMLLMWYTVAQRLEVPRLVSLAGVLLLFSNVAFSYAAHSSRYDIITGLGLLLTIYALSTKLKFELKGWQWFYVGAAYILLLTISRHLLTLSAPVFLLFAIYHFKYHRVLWLHLLAGGLCGFFLLCALYWIGADEFSLFGRGGSTGSYGFVLQQLPIMRPLSRNVQVSNLLERSHLLWSEGRGIYLFALFAILTAIVLLFKNRHSTRTAMLHHEDTMFIVLASIGAVVSWLLLQGSRSYYLFHIAPILVLTSVLVCWISLRSYGTLPAIIGSVAIMLVCVSLQYGRATADSILGTRVRTDQQRAIATMYRIIDSLSGNHNRVLVDVAGLDVALTHRNQETLTLDRFQPTTDAAETIRRLKAYHIHYVILRSSPVAGVFEPGRAFLPVLLSQIAVVQDHELGVFYDDGRSYSDSLGSIPDTLKLFRIR